MHPNFLVREYKGQSQGSRQWALRRLHRGRCPGKWSQKLFFDTWAHPELFCMDQILTSKPKGWTNRDNCSGPDWPLDGTQVAQVKTALQRIWKPNWQWKQHPQKLGWNWGLTLTRLTVSWTKIRTFCTGLKQDPESHNIIFKISGMQPKTTRHVTHQEIPRKRQSTNNNTEMTLMSE